MGGLVVEFGIGRAVCGMVFIGKGGVMGMGWG